MNETQPLLDAVCRDSFEAFACKAFQILEPGNTFEYSWHIGCISEHLEASFTGQIQDLIINISPRMLKSVLTAQIYPAWVLGKQPHHQFIIASYAHTLAERNVMKCRQIVESEWYQRLFPDVQISKDQNQKDYFTTTKSGQVKGTGIGGTITGFGCHTLVIDDPVNPMEALSETVRANAINEIRSTLFSRFNKYSDRKLIMIMQRLHDDDPTGNLLKDGIYHLLKLPAYAHKAVEVTLNGRSWRMEEGDYLSPRLSKQDLDKLRVDLGEYNFAGQYLQEPVPIGGGELLPKWINHYHDGSVKPAKMNVAILIDSAGGDTTKKKKLSDWTAMMVVGLAPDNNYYLLDVIRDRLNPTDRVNVLFMLHRKWNGLCGKPPKVGYEKYGMMTDTHYVKEKQKQDGYYFPIIELGGNQMSKEDRIRRLIPDMQNGRWYFPASLIYVDGDGRKVDLVQEIMKSEMQNFPRSKYDDMIDAMSRIKDPELEMVFPKQVLGTVAKARQKAYNSMGSGSWEDF